MKKQSKLLLLTVAGLLAACTPTPETPSSSDAGSDPGSSSLPDNSSSVPDLPSSSEDSSLPFVDPTPDYTAQDVFAFLSKAAQGTNFTIKETVPSSDGVLSMDYFTYYTENYIHYTYANAGYVKLTDYTGESTLLYNYSNASSPVVEQAVTYSLDSSSTEALPIRDTQTLNPLVDGMKDVKADDILLNYSYFYCKDKTLIEGLSYFLGASSLASKMSAVKFAFSDEKDELTFTFAPDFSSGASDSDVSTIDSLSGVLEAVGTTSLSSMDQFVASYKLPESTLSEEAIASISSSGAYHSKVTYHYEANVQDVVKQDDHVVFAEDAMQRRRVEKGTTSSVYTYLTKDPSSGNAVSHYLDYKNAVIDEDTGKPFSDLAKTPGSLIEEGAFRSSSEGVYTYYGYQGRKLIADLAGFDCGSIESVEITVAEGKITKLHALTPIRKDSYAQSMRYEVDVDFQQEGSITPITPNTDEDYNLMGAIWSFQDDYGYGLSHNFTATMKTIAGNNNYATTMSLFKKDSMSSFNDVLLFDQESVDTEEGSSGDPIHIRWGYYQKDKSKKEVVPFRVNSKGQAISSGEAIAKNLGDILGFDVNAGVFNLLSEDEENGKWVYGLREEAKGIQDHIIAGEQKDYMIPSSLKIGLSQVTLEGSSYSIKVIDKIEYEFNAEGFYKGKDQILFSDYDKTKAPEDLDFSTLKDWVEPEDWDNGAPEVSGDIDGAFGDGTSAKLPFLYQKQMEGQWIIGQSEYDEYPADGFAYRWMILCNTAFMVGGDDEVSKAYMVSFAEKLKKNGFVEKDYPLGKNDSDVASLYSEELNLYVRIPESVTAGIRLLRIETLDATSSGGASSAE